MSLYLTDVHVERRKRQRRKADNAFVGLLLAAMVVSVIAGIFVGIQIERRIETARINHVAEIVAAH